MLLHDDVHFVLSIVFDGEGAGDLKQKLDKGMTPKICILGEKFKFLFFSFFYRPGLPGVSDIHCVHLLRDPEVVFSCQGASHQSTRRKRFAI